MIEFRGVDKLDAISKALREVGRDLDRELSQAIGGAVPSVEANIRQSALTTLPKRGGLARRIAASKFTTIRQQGGIRVEARNSYALARLDGGTVRHPVFADGTKPRRSWTWVNQVVRPGWWTKPVTDATPEFRRQVEAAVADLANRIDKAV